MKPMVLPLLAVALSLSSLNAAPPSATPGGQAPATGQFRLIVSAYDGDPKNPAGMTFQINILDRRQPSEFLRLGNMIPNTKLRLVSFKFVEVSGPKIGSPPVDASELTVIHTETGKETVLVMARATNVPDGAK